MMFQRGRGVVRIAAVAAAGASCLAAAACGGISASSLSAAPSASSTPDPLASLTARNVATEAVANLRTASSLKMAGTVNESGQHVVLNLDLKPGHGCAGTIVEGSEGSFKVIVIGKTIYFNASNQFWKSAVGSEASSVIALINGRYIKTSTSANGMSSMVSLCALSRQMVSQKLTGTFSKGKLFTFEGTKVLPIVNPKEGVLYVTDTSKPEIAEILKTKNTGDGTGKLTFSVGAPVTLTAPPASQVINGSAVGM
jgi:hypothetical protein